MKECLSAYPRCTAELLDIRNNNTLFFMRTVLEKHEPEICQKLKNRIRTISG